jgi:ABC-2 type transport system permease protein
MRKTFAILTQELSITFTRPSFLLFAFGIPLLAVLILAGIKIFQGRSSGESSTDASAGNQWQMQVEGYVDPGGLIRVIPPDLPEDHLLAYENESQAKNALQSGKISAYYVIPSDYAETGEIYYVYPDSKSYLSDGQSWVMQRVLAVNLLDGDLDLADRTWNPVWNLENRSIAPQHQGTALSGGDCSRPGSACESNELVRYMPAIMVVVFYIAFMSSSSMLFSSIGTEKENRTIELLMLSVTPRQLLAGKVMALGFAGLTQTVVWLCAIYISFNQGGATLNLPDDFSFPVNILVWGLVFFIGGFALYANLMAGAGAMVPKMKEAGIANFIAMIPLLFGYGYGLIATMVQNTDTAFMVFLSLFPLTSPVVMVLRMTDGLVPLWELLLAVVLLFVTAWFILRTVAAMFHAQNLLSGQPFSAKRYLRALAGRA